MNVIELVTAPRLCCICGEELADWPCGANNADPVTADGDCCDSCNRIFVIPAREAQ
ncbi:hypothetical protein [Mycolicibacterium lutetiense]|uniref:Uncharacterized protein n=1 Tax=Mycolicibacterium lutetiense TaxID=1641992 RepID=A0ABS4ZLY6_9MYCO|nr:hypothetical protein [Mycolicibacterium lutetiense]MBP2450509.1 hypothetical protein [Mycolicibacterium lutetiense]